MLRAADITEESESSSQGPILSDPMPPPEVRHSVYGPNAFPNDARNFAGVGPDGLTVLTNLIASMHFVTGNFIVHEYTDRRSSTSCSGSMRRLLQLHDEAGQHRL